MNTHKLSYAEIVQLFSKTKNRRVAWNYKNKARLRYPDQYNAEHFIRPVGNMRFVPHSRRSYDELVKMYEDAKYGTTRTSIKNSARTLYPTMFIDEDFPYRTWLPYATVVDKYVTIISKVDVTHNELRMANHFKKTAKHRYPSKYNAEDFPSRWIVRSSYQDSITKYNIINSKTHVTKSELSQLYSIRKRAQARFACEYNVTDFPLRKKYK